MFKKICRWLAFQNPERRRLLGITKEHLAAAIADGDAGLAQQYRDYIAHLENGGAL